MSVFDEILMINFWLTYISKSIHKAKTKELKESLRFSREYLRDRLDTLTAEVDRVPFSLFKNSLSAIHDSYESEIKEHERALNGKDEIWDAKGSKFTEKQIKSRVELLRSLKDETAQEIRELITNPDLPKD